MITIFTDGASRGNPGPGGWGAIIINGDTVTELGGRQDNTTNNRMEMMAVIKALEYFVSLAPKDSEQKAVIYTDSSYVKKGASEWLSNWQKNNWKTKSKKDVLNKDLWKNLGHLLNDAEVEFKLLPGHSNIPGNERCDAIATMFADNLEPNLYSGPIKNYSVDLGIIKTKSIKQKTKSKNKKKPFSYISSVNRKVKTHKTWEDCEKRVKGVSGAKYQKVFSAEEEEKLREKWQND